MPFNPQAHLGLCVVTAMYAQRIVQLDPPQTVTAPATSTLSYSCAALGTSCLTALREIEAMGAAPRYNPAYLTALGGATVPLGAAVAAMFNQMSNGPAVAAAATTIIGLAISLRDPFNMGLPWPETPPIPDPRPAPQAPQRPRWMAQSAALIEDVPINNLVLPGTHDSATYAITAGSTLAPKQDIPEWVNFVYALPIAAELATRVIANWARAQGLNITDQLNAGIRYLDLRVVEKNGQYWTCHSMYGSPLGEVLSAVRAFAEANPRELILLDFNHLYAISSSATLASTILDGVGRDHVVPRAVRATDTLGSIWARNQQVIVLFQDQATVDANPLLWSQTAISSPWPNTDDVERLKAAMDANLSARPANQLFVLQGILTPSPASIGLGILPGTSGSLADFGTKVTPQAVQWVQGWAPTRKPNIVIADWFTAAPNYVDALVALNGPSWPGGRTLTAGDSTSDAPAGCEFNGKLYVVWRSNDPSNRIILSGSGDGANWPAGSPMNATDSTNAAPAVCSFRGKLYVFWKANDPSNVIFWRRSSDGTSFPDGGQLSATDSTPKPLAACEFNGRLYVFWKANDASNRIFYRWSSDGTTWPSSGSINGIDSTPEALAACALNGQLHLLWKANDPTNRIYHSASADGATWPGGTVITGDSSSSSLGLCVAGGTTLYAFWQANDPSGSIYYSASRDGNTWLGGARINLTDSTSAAPAAVFYAGKRYVLWKSSDASNRILWSAV